MHRPRPIHPKTTVHPRTGEWVPPSFDAFLLELKHLAETANGDSMLLYRGHADRRWRLDSTFVREVKRNLFSMSPLAGFSDKLRVSGDLNLSLTGLLLLKFGTLVRPSEELLAFERDHGVDPWFELMKRYQQYASEDHPEFKGTPLVDWTSNPEVALYFANERRSGTGAVFVCDATATGKTLQHLPVIEILATLRTQLLRGQANGQPLLFAPKKQIANPRPKNQAAVYFAQLELRLDLQEQWRLKEASQPDEAILVKLLLPGDSEAECARYLESRGVTASFIYPDAQAEPSTLREV